MVALLSSIVFKEKNAWYGVALEFNLVIDAGTSQKVFDKLNQAVTNYFVAAKKTPSCSTRPPPASTVSIRPRWLGYSAD